MPVSTCASVGEAAALLARFALAFRRARLTSNSAAVFADSSRAFAAGVSVIELATIAATRPRKGPTSPLPSGCTRLLRKITKELLAGSIQIDVPVNPVWPNDPSGKRSPLFEEKVVARSQPSPRAAPVSETARGRVIVAMVLGLTTRTPF